MQENRAHGGNQGAWPRFPIPGIEGRGGGGPVRVRASAGKGLAAPADERTLVFGWWWKNDDGRWGIGKPGADWFRARGGGDGVSNKKKQKKKKKKNPQTSPPRGWRGIFWEGGGFGCGSKMIGVDGNASKR